MLTQALRLLAASGLLIGAAFSQSVDGSVLAPFGPGTLDPPATQAGDGQGIDSPASRDDLAAEAPQRQPIDRNRIYVTPHADGTWVRGRTYKARVSDAGLRYVPFLGADAERNWPLDLRLRSASVGETALELTETGELTHDGQQFRIDRGAVTVRYDVDVDSVAQSFVVTEASFDGDVTLELDLATELEIAASADGWSFGTARGGVHIGTAVALDGERVLGSVPVHCDSGTMRLTVPADLVRGLKGELVIDPIFSTFVVDDYTTIERDVDVAYASLRDQFTFVWEDYFSASDIDIFQAGYDTNGVLLSIGYVDSGNRNWRRPRIASMRAADCWLVVAERTGTGGLGNEAVGRLLFGASMGVGIELVLGEATSGWSNHAPEVGGSWSMDPSSRFLVVWERQFAQDRQIRFRLVEHNNQLSGILNAGSLPNGLHTSVRVSPSTGDPTIVNRWNVACLRWVIGAGLPNAIAGFQVNGNGSIPFGQSLNTMTTTARPSRAACHDVSDTLVVPGGSPTYLILHNARTPSGAPVEALICRNQTVVRRQRTTDFHGPSGNIWEQVRVATTRSRFVMVHGDFSGIWSEDVTVSDWDLEANDRLAQATARMPIVQPAMYDRFVNQVAIASRYSGGLVSEISGLGWAAQRANNSTSDVLAALHIASSQRGFGQPRACGGSVDSAGRRPTLVVVGGPSTVVTKRVELNDLPPGEMIVLHVAPVMPSSTIHLECGRPTCVRGGGGSLFTTADATAGTALFLIDPTNMPATGGPVPAMAGQTWAFQASYADSGINPACSRALTNGAFCRFY